MPLSIQLHLGDTLPLKDIWIQTVNHNQVAYLGNSFPVEVVINAIDLNQAQATVSISHDGKLLKTETVAVNSNTFSKTFNYVFDADKPGIQKYTVSVSGVNDDKNKQNNTQSFIIDVIDNREKILILANAPHPDIAALEQSISNAQTYETEVALVSSFTKPLNPPYSLVILHQISNLPPSVAADLRSNNIPVFFIGSNGFSSTTRPDQRSNEVEANFKKEFSLFNISPELQNYIKELPAVKAPLKVQSLPMALTAYSPNKSGWLTPTSPCFFYRK